jgi:hypothetical protein
LAQRNQLRDWGENASSALGNFYTMVTASKASGGLGWLEARTRGPDGQSWPAGIHFSTVPIKTKKEEPDRELHVGDAVRVKLHDGRIVDATIRALIEESEKLQLRVDYGHEETALIKLSQVVS